MGGGKGEEGARVYVGNLSWDVSSEDLKEHMSSVGEVAFADVMMEASGRSKGCGIVAYCSAEDARRAQEELTDSELSGRQIFVREDRGKGGGKGGKDREDRVDDPSTTSSRRLYVGSLAWDVTNEDLEESFGACGEVTLAEVMTDGNFEGARSKGCGIVEFKTLEQAQKAVEEMHDVEIRGRRIFVREDRGKGKGKDKDKGKGKGKGKGSDGKWGGKDYGKKGYGGKAALGDAGSGKGGDPGCKVFVGNLAFAVSWQDLKDHCRQAGEVVRAEIMTAGGVPGGRSKGCGTVEFATPGEAEEAVRQLTDSELQGRAIFVREFSP